MPLIQFARGLWAKFGNSENPFAVSNGMEANLRRIDDHLALYTLAPPQAPGTASPENPQDGDGQIYTDGSYATFNGGTWLVYAPRVGVRAVLVTGTESWLNTGSGWSQYSVLDTGPAVAAAEEARDEAVAAAADVHLSAATQTFLTYAAMIATTTLPANSQGRVTNDPTAANNKYYIWTGVEWIASLIQPAKQTDMDALSARQTATETIASAQGDKINAHATVMSDGLGQEAQVRVQLICDNEQAGATVAGLYDVFEDEIPSARRAWANEDDSLAALINDDGHFQHAEPDVATPQTGLRAGVCHILGIGQSWMGGTGGAPALTLAPQAGIVMFVGGVRPTDVLPAPGCYASLVPAVESDNAGGVRGETIMSGFARAIADGIAADQGTTLAALGASLLISVVAPGGQALGGFTRGGTYWLQVIEQIQAGYARAQEMGETYRLLCCPVILGKGDYDAGQPDQASFRITLAHLIADVNAAVKALVSDHPDVAFFAYQSASHGHDAREPTIDLALVELDRENPLLVYAGILSAYPRTATDAVHFSNSAHQQLGRIGGAQAYRYLMTGEKPNVMLPVECMAQGRVISLRYRPAALPIVLDDAGANHPAGHGFELLDAMGAPLAIEGITVVRDRVVIAAVAPLPAGWRLRYAFTGAYVAGQISGPRGALRDSANPPNWAGLFQITQ